LETTGAPLDVRRPEQVLSVVCLPAHGFLGISAAADNLSDWAGGAHRFKREAGQISRAEFKLLEALEVFELTLPAGGVALDLGAAPGGWTRVLRRHALRVVAVDPADLHPLIESDPAVVHVRQTAGECLPTREQFDVILNDMRMDADGSVRLMILAADSLKPAGLAVMTLKLPGQRRAQVVARSLDLLRQRYRIVGARQLFHNRREITVALKRARNPHAVSRRGSRLRTAGSVADQADSGSLRSVPDSRHGGE
jgi:23S rRNA (cytidine2498-2'-O)-methyltransferase